jgi:hypothetical protein
MEIDRSKVTECLKNLEFESLFINELGWDYADTATLNLKLSETSEEYYNLNSANVSRKNIEK